MRIKEKMLGILLAVCLCFSSISANVFAAELKEFSFYVVDNADTSNILDNAEGTITIVRDGKVVQTCELQKGSDESGNTQYTAEIDISVVASTDELYLTLSCDGYYSPEKDSDWGAFFGDLSDWFADGYVLSWPDNLIGLDAWDEGIRALNDDYEVWESVDENGTISQVILNYYGAWDEATFTKALSYVEKDEKLLTVIECGENEYPTLSSSLAAQLSVYNWDLCLSSNGGYAEFCSVKSTSSIEVIMGADSNDSVEKKLKNAGITGGYLAYSFLGEGSFESAYIEDVLPTNQEGQLMVPEENITAFEDGISAYGEAEKYLYYYDAESNLFVPCEGNAVYFYEKGDFASEDQDYYGVLFEGVISKFGHYVVCEEKLPISITTESIEKGETVKIELAESKKVEEKVLQEASDAKTPVIIVVQENENNSYVSWQFKTIDNPVEFNPTVKVDTTVEAVKNKLAGVKLPESLKYTTVSFEFAGKLPGAAEVTLDIANSDLGLVNTEEGAVVYLYYYNPAVNVFELIDTSAVTEGYASFNMTHCSDYAITTEKLPEAATKVADNSSTTNNSNITNNSNATSNLDTKTDNKTAPDTSDNNMFGLYFVLLAFSVTIVLETKKRTGWKNYEKRDTIS